MLFLVLFCLFLIGCVWYNRTIIKKYAVMALSVANISSIYYENGTYRLYYFHEGILSSIPLHGITLPRGWNITLHDECKGHVKLLRSTSNLQTTIYGLPYSYIGGGLSVVAHEIPDRGYDSKHRRTVITNCDKIDWISIIQDICKDKHLDDELFTPCD